MSHKRITSIVSLIASWISVIAFLLIGLLVGKWYVAWIVFLLIPISTEITNAILQKKIYKLPVTLIVLTIYLVIGFLTGVWSPTWIMFVFIPLFYSTLNVIGNKEEGETRKKKDPKVVDVKSIEK